MVKTTSPTTPLFASSSSKSEVFNNLPLKNVVTAGPVISTNSDFSAIYRNNAHPNKVISTYHADIDTYQKAFNHSVDINGNNRCLGHRPYNYATKTSADKFEYFTYNQVNQRKRDLGAGIIKSLLANPFKLNTEAHQKIVNHLRDWKSYGIDATGTQNIDSEIEKSTSFIVSIFSANRYEWILTDLACSAYSITNTALYDTLGADVTKYILELTNTPMVVCSKDKIQVVLDLKQQFPKELENVISIVSMDPFHSIDPKLISKAKSLNVVIEDLSQVEQLGKQSPLNELPPSANSLYTISFTSGTTGARPKGAMLSQANAISAISMLAASEPSAGNSGNSAFIFLPLTHIYERQTSGFALLGGYYLGFPQLTIDNPKPDAFANLVSDLRIFKPIYFSIVPRILTRIEALIKNKINQLDERSRNTVNNIIQWKLKEHAKFDGSNGFNKEYDNFGPYKELREFIGFDNLIWTQTASAPVAASTITYLKASLNIGIRQLYGLTETFGAHTNSDPYESTASSCGPCGVTTEVKLRDVSEMGYSTKDLKGELLIGGTQVFKGYYYNQKETDKAFDKEGWFYTGDIARIDDKGRLYIIDRVKNFFKLAQGEYISPEKIENKYLSSNPLISQCYVHGDSVKSYLIGVVGIEPSKGIQFLNEECGYNKLDMSDHEVLDELNDVKNKKKVLEHLNKNVGNELLGFEKLHNVHIENNPLTVERNVVTPTLKLKRGIASKFFGKIFHKLYEIEQSLLIDRQIQAKL